MITKCAIQMIEFLDTDDVGDDINKVLYIRLYNSILLIYNSSTILSCGK